METKRTLKPGQPGTLKYVQQYGDSLVCIRYRYDETRNLCYTTAELIVEKRTYFKKNKNNSAPLPDEKSIIAQTISEQFLKEEDDPDPVNQDSLLSIRIQYGELELRKLVSSAGGKWNQVKKVWELPSKEVAALGLMDRIVKFDT